MNSKIDGLDIERKELRQVMTKLTYLENTIWMFERNNKAHASSNGILVTDNTLFHDKKTKKRRANDKASWVGSFLGWEITTTGYLGNDAMKYQKHLDETSTFIINIANRGNTLYK